MYLSFGKFSIEADIDMHLVFIIVDEGDEGIIAISYPKLQLLNRFLALVEYEMRTIKGDENV